MDISYTIEPRDVVAFNVYQFEHSPSLRSSYRMGYFWLGVLSLLFAFFTSAWQHWILFGGWLVFSLVLFVGYRPLTYWNLRRSIQRTNKEGRNLGIWGKHTIVLQEKELVESSDAGHTSTRWSAVERIEQNDNHIFIYTSAHAAHVIPKRSFSDAKQAEEFYTTARGYLERARAK